MPAYDQSFDPPAPVASILVYHPEKPDIEWPLKARLDTGADVSLLPESVVHAFSLPIVSRVLTEAYDGAQSVLNAYEAALTVEGTDIGRVVMVALAQEDSALLGRDILNRFVITLDGPALAFNIQLSKTS
jgi:predicted aspartyl protease